MPCILLSIVAVWGVVLVLGTYRRWPIIVNPPSGFWSRVLYGNFQSVKKRYGEKSVINYIYLIGISLVIFGVMGLRFLPCVW